MIDWSSSMRRLIVALVALLLALPMLRPALSGALVTRGDALLYARNARAREKYALAFAIDPSNLQAVDRYVFLAFLSRSRAGLEDAVHVADEALEAHPDDAALRMDRGLCLQVLRRFERAEQDFERVGFERGDVQALALAAADSRKHGDRAKALRLLRIAHALDPRYVPVRVALERSRR
ncbi:MAG TPA: hypothetical protein VMD47_08095 [Candidatus Acidoferrales bacterium]|nr:hypothetical protein [Candidatus Acidoferrales bacterium]